VAVDRGRRGDEDHAYGRAKAEHFRAGVEGALIVMGGVGIGATAIERLLHRAAPAAG
jgi:divalent metal cation (Fe/Co/Zn/Cd) transporter